MEPVMFLLRQLLRDGQAPHVCFVLYKVLSLYLLALASGKNFFSFSGGKSFVTRFLCVVLAILELIL